MINKLFDMDIYCKSTEIESLYFERSEKAGSAPYLKGSKSGLFCFIGILNDKASNSARCRGPPPSIVLKMYIT